MARRPWRDRTALANGRGGVAQLSGAAAENEEEQSDAMIDLAKVEGRVKASSVKKVGEIVDKHPEQTVAIVRSWLHQE